MVVTVMDNGCTVHIFETKWELTNEAKKQGMYQSRTSDHRSFDDYTNGPGKHTDDKQWTSKKPSYIIPNCRKIWIGHDTNISNQNIKNRWFGLGNSIFVETYTFYYIILGCGVQQLQKEHIHGRIQGFISPIGSNDCPYPILITDTHVYSWCGDIIECIRPSDPIANRYFTAVCKAKHPFDVTKTAWKYVGAFECGLCDYCKDDPKVTVPQKDVFVITNC